MAVRVLFNVEGSFLASQRCCGVRIEGGILARFIWDTTTTTIKLGGSPWIPGRPGLWPVTAAKLGARRDD